MKTGITRRSVLVAAGASLVAWPHRGAAAESALDRLLSRRRMVRRFTSEPIAESTVRRLLAAATRAPSAGHTEPSAFVVVRKARTREELGRAAHDQMFVAEAPVVVVACADLSHSRARYGERAERYALIDTAFASLLLLLAVVEEGLGACFVGAFRDAEVARLLGLPPHVQAVGIIPVGYAAESPARMKRRPLPEVVHHERWRSGA